MPTSPDTADRTLAAWLYTAIVTLIAATVIASVAAALIDDDLALGALLVLATAVVALVIVGAAAFISGHSTIGTLTVALTVLAIVGLLFVRNLIREPLGVTSPSPGHWAARGEQRGRFSRMRLTTDDGGGDA